MEERQERVESETTPTPLSPSPPEQQPTAVEAGKNHVIFFIHAEDSQAWATFLQNKLQSDDYGIPSSLHRPHHEEVPQLLTSRSSLCAVLVSPDLLEAVDSHPDFWRLLTRQDQRHGRHLSRSTVLLFLGVDSEELKAVLGAAEVAHVLRRHRCVEVDQTPRAVAGALVELIQMYEALDAPRPSAEGEGSGEEVEEEEEEEGSEERGAAGQDDDEKHLYDYLPPPRQHNCVVRVEPRVLFEGVSRDLLVVMKREAEQALTLVLESDSGPSRHVTLEHVTSSVYLATLPKHALGRVNFAVVSGEHSVGLASVQVRTRMEQVHEALKVEANPVALICNAVGAGLGDLDSVLARRLSMSQLPPGLTHLLCSDDPAVTGDQEGTHWPTLLHMAAELNLPRVCEQLLTYPGMVHAACTENSEGLFPCQLAERKGLWTLQHRLIQYVEDAGQGRRPVDSGISFSEHLLPPERHGSFDAAYVNDLMTPTSDEEFMEKGRMYARSKPRSYSEGCVRPSFVRRPSEARIAEEEDSSHENTSHSSSSSPPATPPPLPDYGSRLGRSASTTDPVTTSQTEPAASTADRQDFVVSSNTAEISEDKFGSEGQRDRPKGAAREVPTADVVSRPLSGSEGQRDRPKDAAREVTTADVVSRPLSGSGAISGPQEEQQTEGGPASQTSCCSGSSLKDDVSGVSPTTSRPHSRTSSHSLGDLPSMRQTSLPAGDISVLRSKSKKSKSMQEKISHFFSKMKPTRRQRSSSDTNLVTLGKNSKKFSRQSSTSTQSDPTSDRSSSANSRSSVTSTYLARERDSGAVCDDRDSKVLLRKRDKETASSRHAGKRKGFSSMQRRMSVRVQRARQEDLGDVPTLPARAPTTGLSGRPVGSRDSKDTVTSL